MAKKKAPTPAVKKKTTKLAKQTNGKAKAKTRKARVKKVSGPLQPDAKTGKITIPKGLPPFVQKNLEAFNKNR